MFQVLIVSTRKIEFFFSTIDFYFAFSLASFFLNLFSLESYGVDVH